MSVLVIAALAGSARADEGEAPSFVTLDRQDAVSRAGGELSYLKAKPSARATAVRLDVYGQYVDPGTGLGGYLQLPLGYVSENSESNFGIAGLELGGIYTARASEEVRIVLHAGVILPTAPTDSQASRAVTTAFLARINDFYLVSPDSTTLRGGGAIVIREEQFFARVEAGIDINVTGPTSNRADALFHFDAGIGLDTGAMALMLESSNSYVNGPQELAQESMESLAVAATFRVGQTRPYLAVVIGLDDDSRMFGDFVVTAGVSAVLP